MGLISSGLSDIGLTRKSNQDSIYFNKDINLFVVADGMGGHNGGDMASQLAVKHVPEYVQKNQTQEPLEMLSNSIKYANRFILEKAAQDESLKGMGTTVVSMYFKGPHVHLANVGDSRCYLINKRKLYQLSRDHSLVQEKLNIGIYTREQAAKDPEKNVLVRAVGFEERVQVDTFIYKVSRNDILFICSDGLHSKVSEPDIIHLVNTTLPDPASATQEDVDKAVQQLINQANHNGGNDNISVVMVVAK